MRKILGVRLLFCKDEIAEYQTGCYRRISQNAVVTRECGERIGCEIW